jgi:hypothetical protein
MRHAATAALAATLMTGCLPQDGTGTSSSSTSSSSSGGTTDASTSTLAGKACLDTADAFATAAKRCGGNYDTEYAAFIRDLAGGNCNDVSIRNETELRTQCLPSFQVIACDALANQRFAPSCAEQIIRSH